MVPQIIFIILQLLSFMISFAAIAKENKWKELKWHIIGQIITNGLLIWGGFYAPLMR
jgi:hypothetical protein